MSPGIHASTRRQTARLRQRPTDRLLKTLRCDSDSAAPVQAATLLAQASCRGECAARDLRFPDVGVARDRVGAYHWSTCVPTHSIQMPTRQDQLMALAAYLSQRRDAIMEAWRSKVTLDPKLTTATSLPRAQLHDHLPALLQDFEHRLSAGDSATRADAVDEQKADAAAHGLQRWQQGFGLSEVSRELGRFNECVVAELDHGAILHPEIDIGVMAQARAIWAAVYSVATGSSISRYFELQQLEAAGHVADLEQALAALRELEAQRAELWQQAAHDLRGNLGVVVMATAGLTSAKAKGDAQQMFLASLDRNVRALHRLLEDVTSLARLQGGQELRTLEEMDASRLLRELAEDMQSMAVERKLLLAFDGPDMLMVQGDAIKIRRIVQNLVLNAIKYTHQGGVSVSWGDGITPDTDRWFVQVKDTGPGFHAGPGSSLAGALEAATDQAKDAVAEDTLGDVPHVKGPQPARPAPRIDARAVVQQEGEGIGLSIVKRLCELLDASIEMDSRIGEGTTFRVLLPRQYAN
jgi:signal transduction histidine kinase